MKKRVYVESSVISYLTARPPRDIVRLARHRITAEWWERRERWELCVSPTVLDEVAMGDPEAADRRMDVAKTMVELPASARARELADLLIAREAVPIVAASDAIHLAMAAFYDIPYLATWNQRHLDNLSLRFRIEDIIKSQGLSPALVVTPERLLEGRYEEED